MSRHPLASAIDKLDGAEQQIAALEKASGEGSVTDLLELWTDRDRDGRVRVRVKQLTGVPREWPVWIGECLYNMRSALDHLAYALNIAGSRMGDDPPPNWEDSQFPLYTNQARFRAMCRRPLRKCPVGYFPRGARTVAERLQPYHRRQDDDAWRLGELVALSNIDKHRRPPLTPLTSSIAMPPVEIEGHPIERRETFYRRLKPNATIMRFEVPTLPLSVKHPKVNFGHGAEIEFEGKAGNPPVPLVEPHSPVWFVLRSIHRTVRERVLPDFERFL